MGSFFQTAAVAHNGDPTTVHVPVLHSCLMYALSRGYNFCMKEKKYLFNAQKRRDDPSPS